MESEYNNKQMDVQNGEIQTSTKIIHSSFLLGEARPDFQREESLPDIFRTTCQDYADSNALIFKERQLTYRELDRWSDAIAANLHQQGIGSGKVVACYLSRGLGLHATILGILKSGACYVAISDETPIERTQGILVDSNAAAIFTDKDFPCACLKITPLAYSSYFEKIDLPISIKPDDAAYILYTSGSTGKPKGVLINHRQICHFLRSEQFILGIAPGDKVYQGFSVSFDMWLEETWISYLVGATLWVADSITTKSLDELGTILRSQQITVLHAVPSLLAIVDNDIPTLRVVNAGGEACNEAVVKRWARKGCQLFNSYGPSEASVSSTIIELKPGDEITIGKPLPNYAVAIVDENLTPVPPGEMGEIIIAGPGVGQGYVNLEKETATKFIRKPESLHFLPGQRLYRTGDQAQLTSTGDIRFLGRIDTQVKIRGYRVELSEIEMKLQSLPSVAIAVVTLKKPDGVHDELVAYVLPVRGSHFDISAARSFLSAQLPPYMVPGHIVIVDELPRLTSGKIDLKSLPDIKNTSSMPDTILSNDMSVGEITKLILQNVISNNEIDLKQDFFNDLGGHSLLAAGFVSSLRNNGGFKTVSIRDVYVHRPLNKFVEFLEKTQKITLEPVQKTPYHKTSTFKHALCLIAQTIALIPILGMFSSQIFLPYLIYYYVQQDTQNHLLGIFSALGFFCFLPPLFLVTGVVAKWLIIGRYKPGHYPLWGWYYFRWWLVKSIQTLGMSQYLHSSPFFSLYLRSLGVKVHLSAQLSQLHMGAEDLIQIGKNVTISSGVNLNNAHVENGLLKISAIEIHDHAYIGTSVVIDGDCKINRFGELNDLSYLHSHSVINENELWHGSPAKKCRNKTAEECIAPTLPTKTQALKAMLLFLIPLLALPLILVMPIAPGIIILNIIDTNMPAYNFSYLIYTPLIALLYISLFVLLNIGMTRWMSKNILPGCYPIYGRVYFKKWFIDQIQTLSLFAIYPLYASIYAPLLMRLLGSKIGKGTEISTANNVTHRMLKLGKGSFIADAVVLGEFDTRNQQMILRMTTVGNNSFIGNSAVIPQGYTLPDNMLVGVLSVPPTQEQLLAHPDTNNWFGSPTIPLPTRDVSIKFPDHLTNRPSLLRFMLRALVETIRIILPIATLISLSVIFIAFADDLLREKHLAMIILLFPFYYLGLFALPVLSILVALKWLIVGRYRCSQYPMWTYPVWRSEAITTFYEGLCVPFFLEYLKGTAWLPWVFRLLGMKTGKQVWLNSTYVTEFDMVKIGDNTEINHSAGPQTHLFEDRIMKVGKVEIGARVSLGCGSIVLYDVKIEDDVKMAPLSLAMKGERLEQGTEWIGNPIEPMINK